MELNPDTVVWEYTLKCDSGCLHCGSDAKDPRKNELDTAESLGLVDQIADLGFRLIVLSGGEPTLRPDWKTIGAKVNERNLDFAIISNTLAWTGKTIEDLANLNPYSIGISVDGEEKTHDYLRGHKGSHKKIFDSIRALKERNQTVCAVTTVNNLNFRELQDIRNRLIVYGVDAWQIQTASPMGRMAKQENLILNSQAHYKLGKFVAETAERLPHMNVVSADCLGYFGKLGERLGKDNWRGCGAGTYGLGIMSDGTVKGCLSIWHPDAIEGNIRERSLRRIWEDPNNFAYNRKFKPSDLRGDCEGCDLGDLCKGGCNSQSISFYSEFHNSPYCFHRHEKEFPRSK
ncbi:radical SAM protein [archaeon]|jgi:radical SAM protein with 4Fe4S-binding SPASM domain|nr:radical SAM protein [archaeon]MBT3577484.1 radical SAM protein [archaeon]MBT6820273.1 radical SAM protein [archaeon]MBT6955921.1 radical SAM protein [archaeon]MBT7025087.1 radical SAM protein [archaeon]